MRSGVVTYFANEVVVGVKTHQTMVRLSSHSSMVVTLPCAAVAIICISKPKSQQPLRTRNMYPYVL